MKKFYVNCDFNGQSSPFTVYIGVPEGAHHPLHFQADWLGKNRGGSIPSDFMDAVARLKDLADKNNVLLEDLCVYALGAAQQEIDGGAASQDLADEENSTDQTFDDDLEFDFEDLIMSPGEGAPGDRPEDLIAGTPNDQPSQEFLDNELNNLQSDSTEFNNFNFDEYLTEEDKDKK